jgi:hypothetical protein
MLFKQQSFFKKKTFLYVFLYSPYKLQYLIKGYNDLKESEQM